MNIEWQLLEAGYCTHPEISSRQGGSWRACEFPALVALLWHPRQGWLLFDTGYGQAFADATARLPEKMYRWVTPVSWTPRQAVLAQIRARGLKANDITHVLISHFHADHVGALPEFETSRLWCARTAWEYLHGRSRIGALTKGLLPALAPRSLQDRLHFFERIPTTPLPPELAPFSEGHDIFQDGSLYAVALPGHAPGHFGACFRTVKGWVFLVADAAWSVQAITENAPPPRWTTDLLGDTNAYRRTLTDLHTLSRRSREVILVPSHCRSLRPRAP